MANVTTTAADPVDAQPAPAISAAQSVLDRVRAAGDKVRENHFFDLELPCVGQNLGVRLGVPTETSITYADDMLLTALGGVQRDVADEIAFLAHQARDIVTGDPDHGWTPVEGLTITSLAEAHVYALEQRSVEIHDQVKAMGKLFMLGRPPQVHASFVVTAAKAYRMWAQTLVVGSGEGDEPDPTVGL